MGLWTYEAFFVHCSTGLGYTPCSTGLGYTPMMTYLHVTNFCWALYILIWASRLLNVVHDNAHVTHACTSVSKVSKYQRYTHQTSISVHFSNRLGYTPGLPGMLGYTPVQQSNGHPQKAVSTQWRIGRKCRTGPICGFSHSKTKRNFIFKMGCYKYLE